MFLYDAWYVAAWSKDVTVKPMARTLLNEPVVFFRTEAGAVHALAKRRRSPHCQAPWPTIPTISCVPIRTIRA